MSQLVSATQAVVAGATSQAVAFSGVVQTPFQIAQLTPGWATTIFVAPATKVASGFTATFTVPAPAGGSSFDYSILAPAAAATSLANYLSILRELLHDPNDGLWTAAQKTLYLNLALQKRDRDTGQNRTLITFVTTVGTDTYTFTNLGNTNVFDLIAVNLIYQNLRVVLGAFSFTELNARVRQYQPVFQWAPVAYARYGPSQFIVAPAPAIAYTLELDCSQITPANFLVNGTDTDLLPAPYDAPVPLWAAYLAKYNERAYDEAQTFKDWYTDEIGKLDSNKIGLVPSLYPAGTWAP